MIPALLSEQFNMFTQKLTDPPSAPHVPLGIQALGGEPISTSLDSSVLTAEPIYNVFM